MEETLEALVEFAITHQHVILEIELAKGVPLNYRDESGQYVLQYPDGHVEKADLPPCAKRDECQR